jgi:hypothetical protein
MLKVNIGFKMISYYHKPICEAQRNMLRASQVRWARGNLLSKFEHTMCKICDASFSQNLSLKTFCMKATMIRSTMHISYKATL